MDCLAGPEDVGRSHRGHPGERAAQAAAVLGGFQIRPARPDGLAEVSRHAALKAE